jgi:hypothetical protein
MSESLSLTFASFEQPKAIPGKLPDMIALHRLLDGFVKSRDLPNARHSGLSGIISCPKAMWQSGIYRDVVTEMDF